MLSSTRSADSANELRGRDTSAIVRVGRHDDEATDCRRVMTLLTWLLVGAITWGTLAFGGVYPWAFIPLLIASLGIGATALLLRPAAARVPRRLAWAFAAIAAGTATQLVPVPSHMLAWLSPATDRFLREYDILYAWSADSARHPFSIDPRLTWRGFAFLCCYGCLLIGLVRTLTRSIVVRLAGSITALGMCVAMAGIVQRALSNGKIYGFWEPLEPLASPFGPFVNRNHFAGWMLMTIPLTLGLIGALASRSTPRNRSGWRGWMTWGASSDGCKIAMTVLAFVVMALALVLTNSRSGIIGLITTFIFSLTFVWLREKRRTQRFIGAGVLAALAVLIFLWAGVDNVFATFADPGTRNLSGRLPIWKDTGRIIRDFPLTGTGLGTYGVSTVLYQRTLPLEHLQEAHNDYLQLAAEGGLVLGIPIASAIVLLIVEIRRRLRDDKSRTLYWIRAGAIGGCLAISFQEIAEFSLQMPGNALLFVVLVAISLTQSSERPGGTQRLVKSVPPS